ncbi:MAG: InlB B-repeat-containing protein [Bacilli bacterium]|nr:InlB B-repeat-containing protein [Bacilli bacterium]
MRNNIKKLLILIIFFIALFIPNAYAANGFSVEDISVDSKSGTIDVVDPVLSSDEVVSNIKFNQKDDYVTFDVTIKNNESEAYAINSITDNNSNDKFVITYNYSTDYIQPNETTNIKITFTYKETEKNVDKVDINDLVIKLSLVSEEGEIKGDDIIINPTTNDKILKYIMWLVIAFVGIVLSLYFVKDKKIKSGLIILCLSLVFVPIASYANEEITLKLKFTSIELVGEYEDYEIQIKDKDGNVIETRTITYGQKLGALTHDDITGYVFDKYVDQNGNEVTEDTIITGPISVLLKYTANTYQVSFNKNNEYAEGSMSNQTFTYDVEQALTTNAFTYTGYHFVEWNTTAAGTGNSYTDGQAIKNLLTEGSVELFAIWTENTDTPYVVYHYQQQINGSYLESDKDELTGTTGAVITPSVKNYEGFTAPSTTTTTISRFGNTEITYEYLRNRYNLTIVHPEYVEVDKSGTYYYGEQVTLNAKTRAGYTFDGWSNGATTQEITVTIGTSDISVEPLYTANTDTPYLVVHKYETLNGGWETVNAPGTGTTDTTIPAALVSREGFTSPAQQNITITGDGEASITYEYTRNQYTLTIVHPEYVEADKSGTYYYEEQVILNAINRAGYTFDGWSNGATTQETTITIGTSNVSVEPLYTANTDTTYYVDHKYETLNGDYVTETATETGTTDTTVSAPVIPRTGFKTPSLQQVTINGNGQSRVEYVYDREEYTVTFNTDGGSEVADQTIIYGNKITKPTDPTKTGYTFDNWYTDDTYSTVFNFDTIITSDTTIYAKYNINTYTVTFNTDGGSTVPSQTINSGGTVTRPTTDPTKTGYVFDDWYTTDQYTTKFDFENTAITEDTTIYAKFDELKTCADNENITRLSENTCSNNENITIGDGIVCRRAVKLHEETCSQTDETYYCSGAGYTTSGSKGTSTITYGSCGTSGTLTSGDAFTCDVNGDGDFDELTERFYYVSDYYDTSSKEFDTSTAVLIYYNNITSGVSCNKNTFAYDSSNENWHGPRTLVSQLPTTSQWSNVSLKSDTRAILAEYLSTHDSPTVAGGGTLPTDFSYEGYAARLLTAKELMSGCNLTEVGRKTTGELDSCNYIMENTRYAKSTIGNTGTWLETPYAFNSDTGWYEGGYYRSIRNGSTNNTNFGGVRPVIEVPKSKIEYGAGSVYTVTLNANGGSVNPTSITVNIGDTIGTLPTPTQTGKTFDGWYTNLTDGIKVDSTYVPEGNITLIAKWIGTICVKSTTLHTETCNSASGKGCRANGYSSGDTIEYGNIIDSDTLKPGDAFDCNVDGSGYNQRFYYVTNNGDNAVLISYITFSGDKGQSDINVYYNYDTSLTLLPTTTQWSNLPVTFEIQTDDYRPARFIRLSEIEDMTNKTYSELKTDGALNGYEFLFENSLYSGIGERSTAWLEQESDGKRIRYRNDTRKLDEVTSDKYNTSNNCIKPIIEVPMNLINDQYIIRLNTNGGTLSGNSVIAIDKGDAIGTLPTPTKSDHQFIGWFTSSDYTTQIDSTYVPNGYETLYAGWSVNVEDSTLEKDNFILSVGESDRIVINNINLVEPREFTSTDSTIASVDSDGVIMALSAGDTTITITGLISNTTKTVNVKVHEVSNTFVVSFDTQGGDTVEDIEVTKNTAIGTLPSTGKVDFDFAGWYTDSTYSTEVTEETIITSDVTFVAKWIPVGTIAEIDGAFYSTLSAAFADVPIVNNPTGTDADKTTIKILKDFSSDKIDLTDSNKLNRYVILDLNNKTFTVTSGNAIDSNIKFLEIKNGTIASDIAQGVVNVQSNSTLHVSNASIINTRSRQGVYNNGGTVVIKDNSYIENKGDRAALHNLNNGVTTVLSGTIYSKNFNAILNASGTVNIGEKDGIYDTDIIEVKSGSDATNNNQLGIKGNVNIYDGMIMGKKAAIENEDTVQDTEEGASKVTDSITEGTITYYRLYYSLTPTTYKVTLEPNGGTVSPNTLHVDKGQEIGNQLPTPTRGVYTFDGWYTNLTDGILVDEHTIPQGNETYVAKWHYEASTEIDNFNMTNDVMTAYYNSIGTWKNDQSTFQANMDANFNYYGCKCNENTCSTSGTNLCDKPNGYDTGFTGQINVYDSSEANKEKGSPVTYTTSDNGVIYNMIPGQTYYWELDSDPQVHGLVKAEGNRRTLNINGVRNARDLGGLKVDTDGDGTVDGTLKYGIIFRGERLYSDTNNVTQLAKLGINEEIDLRKSSEIPTTEAQFPTDQFKHREIKHYQIDYQTQYDNYKLSRDLVIEVMEDIIAGKKVYFHCRIGTDRTGTLAYILEGLLGVTEEDMLEDYELSYFFGLVNRHRYYATDPNSSVSKDQKFVYMYNSINDDGGVYSWFVQDCQTQQERQNLDDLIQAFRDYMIE